jgi:hypothetical protein
MPAHKYKIGRTVQFVSSGLRPTPPGQFEILRTLPTERGIAQYRIKSLKDGHERVATESELA